MASRSGHPAGPSADPGAAAAGLRAGRHCGREETRRLVDGVLEGGIDPAALGPWLVALADLGESADEIAGAADALRARMLTLPRVPGTAAGAVAASARSASASPPKPQQVCRSHWRRGSEVA